MGAANGRGDSVRRITEIIKTGPYTTAEQKKLWKHRDKINRIKDRQSTKDYMNRMSGVLPSGKA
jgi:hypothetical protein